MAATLLGKVQLRPYQQEAVSYALARLAQGKRSLLQLPTGTGKSLVLMELARQWIKQTGSRVYLLAPTMEAISAILRQGHSFGLRAFRDFGNRSGGRSAPLTISTYASGWRRAYQVSRTHGNPLLLLDECHHCNFAAPSNISILKNYAYAIGTSATPWSSECQSYFDNALFTYRLSDSISAGHNANFEIFGWKSPTSKNHPIIYAETNELSQICSAMASCDYAICTRMDARKIIQRYRLGSQPAIVVNRMLMEGFDYPQCKDIYIHRSSCSDIELMQMAGRALRPYRGLAASIYVRDPDTRRRLVLAIRRAG